MKITSTLLQPVLIARGSCVVSVPLTSVVIGRLSSSTQTVLVFGRHANAEQQRQEQRLLFFAPGAILCYLTYRTKAPGIGLQRLDILQAVAPGERCSRILGVKPGADVLLRVRRAGDIQRVRALIAEMRVQGVDPSDVSAAYWIVVQNRLSASEALPAFSVSAHAAGACRRKLGL
jgi:hypothetical protein